MQGFDLKYRGFDFISEKYGLIQICSCWWGRRNTAEVKWEFRDSRKESTILGTETILYSIEAY